MGLHLNFELHLPATTSREEIAQKLELLREHALGTPVYRVTDLYSADHVLAKDDPSADRLEHFFRMWASIIAHPTTDHPERDMIGDERTALGFVVAPGQGCEPAPFGFYRRRHETGLREEWHWHTCCKTQYASVVSDEHLVTCHTALVSILDRALALGIAVIVRDETGYWLARDVTVLIESVHQMNRIVATFAGALSDQIAEQSSSVAVQAPIFEHHRFERLEMGE
ncbi:MAG TPA: hypothetical protein VJU87_02815 [Gemmatimonadaceae bacterium]|nr:hypothetical protein [Gemmatimonadaceae bacterium]